MDCDYTAYSLPRTTCLVRKHSNNEARMVGRLFKESVVQSFSNPTKRYRGTDTRECM